MTMPSDDCRPLFAYLSAYLDGELPAVDCRRLERHCRECRRCRTVIDGLRRTVALCRESGRQTRVPPAVRARARARIARLLSGTSRSRA
jgi:predicted anti-sigma-YlaC factor YlaD